MTYFRDPLPDYYRQRWCVSLLSSEWDQVVPHRSNNQGFNYTIKNLARQIS